MMIVRALAMRFLSESVLGGPCQHVVQGREVIVPVVDGDLPHLSSLLSCRCQCAILVLSGDLHGHVQQSACCENVPKPCQHASPIIPENPFECVDTDDPLECAGKIVTGLQIL